MTQPRRGRSDLYQILVFFVILVLILIALVVGGSSGQAGTTPVATSEATAVVTSEATTAATAESTMAATLESTAETTAAPTVEATMDMTAEATAAAVAPRVYFRAPTDNAIVPPKFTVEMGADGLTVEPAGDVHEGAGHFHILIDTPFIDAGQIIPKDDTHLHFGQGQTEAQLELTPGDHVLRLQFADGAHTALEGDQYRAEIHVTVVEGAPDQSVRFVTPADGATVPETFDVVMAATGLIVEPAGDIHDNAGHFHILIDTPFIAAGEVIPKDDTHLHFGKGQLTTSLTLTPGTHVLRLQFADGAHTALEGDQYRAEITVNVSAGS
ncbi:MAG: DUF4399 domain-containing protein [Chloroflexi bacterium]|nr:DUF4399 domain-containing protein [Chloroflexota bacterium]